MKKILIVVLLCLAGVTSIANDKALKTKTLVEKKEVTYTGGANYISGKKQAVNRISAIFPYHEDNAYEIFVKGDYVTTIKLEPNEDVLFIAGGNTEGFMIDQTRGGKDGASLIYIKPLFEDLDTNMIITTDKRVYYFNVKTSKTIFNPMVRFDYPTEREIVAYTNEVSLSKFRNEEAKSTTPTGIDYEKNAFIPQNNTLNLNYEVLDQNSITPNLIYNDGLKTYVRMPKGIQELPILEVLDEKGKPEKVNQRVAELSGYKYFIVDKIFNNGQLKLGNKVARFSRIEK